MSQKDSAEEKGSDMTPQESFEALKRGDFGRVGVLLEHLNKMWNSELIDLISKRIAQRPISKKAKLREARRVAKEVFRNTALDMFTATANGYLGDLSDLCSEFGVSLRYWVLYAVIEERL
ncbi:hypothetical protein ACFLXE_02910 [Chloroflexota bacterium]